MNIRKRRKGEMEELGKEMERVLSIETQVILTTPLLWKTVRLSTMTVNNGQGQTFHLVGLFLLDAVFSNVQLYVRCKSLSSGYY